jgi:RHS repeat-associated protein
VFFQYADEGLVAEYDGKGTEIKTYGYKPGSTWTTDPLFMKEGTEYYFYHNDHLGTPQKMTAVNGAVVWGAQYEAFGKASVDGGSTVVNNLRFPGQYFDAETGLCYNFHRYYDPVSGRYFRVDPIGLVGGINLFTYVLNNPVNSIDPLGHEPVGPIFGPGGLKRPKPCLKQNPPVDPIKRRNPSYLPPSKPTFIGPLEEKCECYEYFHDEVYWTCVLTAMVSPDTIEMLMATLGAAALSSAAFTPAVGGGVAITGGVLIGYTIGKECGEYATFCDEIGPGPNPFL